MNDFGLLSLLPALVTIVVAIYFRRVAWALFFGVVTGALAVVYFNPIAGGKSIVYFLYAAFADKERIEIAIFILLVGGLLRIISVSGAYGQFARKLADYLTTPKKTRLATWLLSFCLFFDDYSNVLITGASMRSISDRHQVSRAMLAYLIDVLAALSSVMVISTWVAFESSLMLDAARPLGIERSGLSLFLASFPYHIYTFLAIFLTFLVAWSGRWFSHRLDPPIRQPIKGPEIMGQGARSIHVVAPIATLVFSAGIGLFLSGYLIAGSSGAAITITDILGNAPVMEVLLLATLLAIGVSILMLRRSKVLPGASIRVNFFRGMRAMIPAGMVIILANGLAAVSEKLGTGNFISASLGDMVSPVLLPAFIYLIAALITMATGFSWSSMAIVMPIAYQMAMEQSGLPMIPVVSGAVICGAITGAQLIPYSDKTVMTAAACGISPIVHVKTQIPQVAVVAIVSIGGYLALGYGYPLAVVYAGGIGIILIAHLLART